MLELSVIIPTHNRTEDLLNLLNSLDQQSLSTEQFEVVVVSNFEEPFYKTKAFQSRFENLQLVYRFVGALNVNRARNLGIKISKGHVLQFIDDDCLLESHDFLCRVLKAHKLYPAATVIGGCYDIEKEASPIDKAYNCISNHWQSLDYFGDYSSSRLVGGNVSYKSKLLKQSNELFNEAIRFGATESELHNRLYKKDHEMLCLKSLRLLHQTRLNTRSLVERAYCQAKGYLSFHVDEGFSQRTFKTYQSTRDLLALQMSESKEDYLKILKYMKIYDKAFNLTLIHPDWSVQKIHRLSKTIEAVWRADAARV